MVTMKDVAREAGVSRPTVSMILNGRDTKVRISKATKKQVLNISEKLGYRRNAIALSMKTGKTNVIGVIGGLYCSYSMEIINGISDILSQHNYIIKLLPTETLEEAKTAVRQCVEQRLAGVICRSFSDEGLDILRSELEPRKVPVVLVDGSSSHNWCFRVTSDDFEGAKQATEHLLKLGHRKIAHIKGRSVKGYSQIRCNGYIQMMADWGIEVQENDICSINAKHEISDLQYQKIRDFLKQQKPTAVFCSTDPLAMKLIAATISEIKIPQDLSVVGFADLDFSVLAAPALTTVKQPFRDMGRKAAEILLSEIKHKSTAREFKLPTKLIIRKSTAKVT